VSDAGWMVGAVWIALLIFDEQKQIFDTTFETVSSPRNRSSIEQYMNNRGELQCKKVISYLSRRLNDLICVCLLAQCPCMERLGQSRGYEPWDAVRAEIARLDFLLVLDQSQILRRRWVFVDLSNCA
jgi:hypothetical protein